MEKTFAKVLLAAVLVGGMTFATADVALAAGKEMNRKVIGHGFGETSDASYAAAPAGARSQCSSGRTDPRDIKLVEHDHLGDWTTPGFPRLRPSALDQSGPADR